MRCYFIIISTLLLIACEPKQPVNVETHDPINSSKYDSVYDENSEEPDSETDTFFIVIADTGNDYYALRHQMLNIAGRTTLTIDTFGRYYDKEKNLIKLPDDDEDEVYRGDYFPRRFPSEHLSLEYLVLYKPISGEKTIALVAGIFENKRSADSARQSISGIQPKTFVIKSEIYTGCMH